MDSELSQALQSKREPLLTARLLREHLSRLNLTGQRITWNQLSMLEQLATTLDLRQKTTSEFQHQLAKVSTQTEVMTKVLSRSKNFKNWFHFKMNPIFVVVELQSLSKNLQQTRPVDSLMQTNLLSQLLPPEEGSRTLSPTSRSGKRIPLKYFQNYQLQLGLAGSIMQTLSSAFLRPQVLPQLPGKETLQPVEEAVVSA